MWSLAKDLGVRPSAVIGIADPFPAFCVDRALWFFSKTIEHEQELAVARLPKNAKDSAHTRARQRVLDKYLGLNQAETPGRFRAPG